MAAQLVYSNSSSPIVYASSLCHQNSHSCFQNHLLFKPTPNICFQKPIATQFRIRCSSKPTQALRTCKNCKTQFDPSVNHPRACRYHTAHFGGETKRKFESVHTGGTMNTPDSGTVLQYWHCCGSEDPFDPGCTAAPHSSYDD
ncbi:Calcium-activated potassium channel subunit alpha-1 like [Actinidia chinensis var. chinensis]|uniref:Calcium-activated potassium channel subunit alpha-1 like n=1 Tax=Actinidia chinensis var. chinensis TaxID=1590841 RepID=A0A2R6PA12_ACTCC|nr:Calcium-activated potassium channel subunit alpha-1 like [Actinidia chinensis var. chinensis]